MRYDPDHEGIGRLLVGPEMHKLVKHFADAGMRHAIEISPEDTGKYKTSFEVETGLERNVTKEPGLRAVARIHNRAEHASAVEWYTNGSGYRILTRTLDFIEGWRG